MNSLQSIPSGFGNRLARVAACLVVALLLGLPTAHAAGLGRVVVVGDSLAAGYQNSSLLMTQQPHGFGSLVAEQAGSALPLPLIAPPGIPPVLELIGFAPDGSPIIQRAAGISPGRVDPTVQAMNLAVPGHTALAALALKPDMLFDDLTDLVLGLPGMFGGVFNSQVEWAEALAPDTVLLWLGSNDTLWVAVYGDLIALTPPAQFAAAFDQVMDRIAATGARIAVANVPDITVIPFLTPAEDVLAQVSAQTGYPVPVLSAILGIGVGDYLNPDAFGLIPIHLFSQTPLPGNVVVDATEVAAVQAATAEMNAFISAKAAQHGAALVDVHGLLNDVDRAGLVVGGQRLTTDFLGGIFTLDGIHPTNTAHAVLANAFIQGLNTTYGTDVPKVSVKQVSSGDPLLLEGVGTPPRALGHPDPSVTAAMKALRSP